MTSRQENTRHYYKYNKKLHNDLEKVSTYNIIYLYTILINIILYNINIHSNIILLNHKKSCFSRLIDFYFSSNFISILYLFFLLKTLLKYILYLLIIIILECKKCLKSLVYISVYFFSK